MSRRGKSLCVYVCVHVKMQAALLPVLAKTKAWPSPSRGAGAGEDVSSARRGDVVLAQMCAERSQVVAQMRGERESRRSAEVGRG